MGRTNWILVSTGVAAAAALALKGIFRRDFLGEDGTALLCILVAVPLVIAAMRMDSAARTRDFAGLRSDVAGLRDDIAAVRTTIVDHTKCMTEVVEHHGDRVTKGQLEKTLGIIVRAETEAKLKRAEELKRAEGREGACLGWNDTGPFPAARS